MEHNSQIVIRVISKKQETQLPVFFPITDIIPRTSDSFFPSFRRNIFPLGFYKRGVISLHFSFLSTQTAQEKKCCFLSESVPCIQQIAGELPLGFTDRRQNGGKKRKQRYPKTDVLSLSFTQNKTGTVVRRRGKNRRQNHCVGEKDAMKTVTYRRNEHGAKNTSAKPA